MRQWNTSKLTNQTDPSVRNIYGEILKKKNTFI